MRILCVVLSIVAAHAAFGSVLMVHASYSVRAFRRDTRAMDAWEFLGLWIYYAFAWSLAVYMMLRKRRKEGVYGR